MITSQTASDKPPLPIDDTLAAARAYVALGLSVIPVKVDGTKAPAELGWREFTTRRPTDAELLAWFGVPGIHGIGIPGGPASGNLVVLDFEKWSAFGCWGGSLTAEDRDHLASCPVIRTPSGGAHLYCRLTGSVRGAKYAKDTAGKCLIETRGEGHQVVAPGSPASCHRTGIPYRLARAGWLDGGSFDPIPLEVFNVFCLYAAELNEYRRPAAREVVGDRPSQGAGDRPGDHFNQAVCWGDILSPAGWTVFRSTSSTTYWCRPGKSPRGISASTGFCRGPSGNDLLWVFSSSATPFEADTSYSKFGAYSLLHHRGDFLNATRTLGKAGYGVPMKKGAALMAKPTQKKSCITFPLHFLPAGGRGKRYTVTANNGAKALHSDTFSLASDKHREAFAKKTITKAYGADAKDWMEGDFERIVQELLSATVAPPGSVTPDGESRPPIAIKQFTESGYGECDGSTYQHQTKLANFSARIVGEIISDDGAEQSHDLSIEVKQKNRPPVTADVPVARFASLDWVVGQFGTRCIIQAGNGKKEHLRCAIQEMSGESVPSTTVYRHTGWREIGDHWHYLHGDGAIAPVAPVEPVSQQVTVRLEGSAARFRLPTPPVGTELQSAVRASLGILDGLTPDHVSFSLLATTYRAALNSPDYAFWLSGPTGALKSELLALAQQHYGPEMVREKLPGNWSSTDNAMEGLAFIIKDAPLVIDDFAPSVSRNDSERQHRTAERLIRGQGNHAGRQRMRADGSLRPPKPPRGLIMSTGEDLPRGHSITARLCVVEIQQNDVAKARLTQCQQHAVEGLYAAAMAGFISWLAPQYATVQSRLAKERIDYRNHFVGKYPHARTPDIVANLLVGLRYLLLFAEAAQAIDTKKRDELWERGERSFRELARSQGEHLRAVDPVARFREMIATIISSGRGHVASPGGYAPSSPLSEAAWGWESRMFRSGDQVEVNYHARGSKIGWVDGPELYLDQESTYAALVSLARDQGQSYPVGADTLWRRLKEAEHLSRTDEERTTCQVSLEGRRRRVMVLSSALSPVRDTGATGATGA